MESIQSTQEDPLEEVVREGALRMGVDRVWRKHRDLWLLAKEHARQKRCQHNSVDGNCL